MKLSVYQIMLNMHVLILYKYNSIIPTPWESHLMTYPASILAPCFCPDTDWWALSVIAVATDMNLWVKKKLKTVTTDIYIYILS